MWTDCLLGGGGRAIAVGGGWEGLGWAGLGGGGREWQGVEGNGRRRYGSGIFRCGIVEVGGEVVGLWGYECGGDCGDWSVGVRFVHALCDAHFHDHSAPWQPIAFPFQLTPVSFRSSYRSDDLTSCRITNASTALLR